MLNEESNASRTASRAPARRPARVGPNEAGTGSQSAKRATPENLFAGPTLPKMTFNKNGLSTE